MKTSLRLILAASLLAVTGVSITAEAATTSVALSKRDYIEGGRYAGVVIGQDPTEQGRYNAYLFGTANLEEALHAGDQSQIDYWQGFVDAIGPVVIPY